MSNVSFDSTWILFYQVVQCFSQHSTVCLPCFNGRSAIFMTKLRRTSFARMRSDGGDGGDVARPDFAQVSMVQSIWTA